MNELHQALQRAVTKNVETTTTTRTELQITGKQLLEMLSLTGIKVSMLASVQFHVPGGGDWSNTEIDVDERNPIHVSFETRETRSEP